MPERTCDTFHCRYRGAGKCTVNNYKSLIYFTGMFPSHHLNELNSGFSHFTYTCSTAVLEYRSTQVPARYYMYMAVYDYTHMVGAIEYQLWHFGYGPMLCYSLDRALARGRSTAPELYRGFKRKGACLLGYNIITVPHPH